jgi:hypothetical protein
MGDTGLLSPTHSAMSEWPNRRRGREAVLFLPDFDHISGNFGLSAAGCSRLAFEPSA